jgi:hypothetical protein
MLNLFYKLIGFFAKVVASIVVLVIITGGVTTYLYNDNSGGENKTPNVKFSNFEEFKNSQYKVLTKEEQRISKEKFQEEFLKKFSLISKNISIYATATKQAIPNRDALEEGLFMIVSKFDYPLRSSYLEQLVKETNNLVNYSEVVAIDKTKTTIKWIDFLDWFSADFEYQLKNNTFKEESITINMTQFEQIVIGGIALLLTIMSTIMFLLVRPDDDKNIIEVKREEKKEETPKKTPSEVKKETPSAEKAKEDKTKEETAIEVKEEVVTEASSENHSSETKVSEKVVEDKETKKPQAKPRAKKKP